MRMGEHRRKTALICTGKTESWTAGRQMICRNMFRRFQRRMKRCLDSMEFRQFSWKKESQGRVTSGDARLLEDMATENRKIITQIWELSDGSRMRVSVTVDGDPKRLTSDGQLSPRFEYQFRYHDRSSERYPGMTSYDMRAGLHRIDRIPEGKYVLLETRVPDGYQGAEPILITVDQTENIVRSDV